MQGKFQVVYNSTHAAMSWPKPSGKYTRQSIRFWVKRRLLKRELSDNCTRTEYCNEVDIPLNKTKFTVRRVPGVNYEIYLLLYDGDIQVQSFKPVIIPSGTDYTVYSKCIPWSST